MIKRISLIDKSSLVKETKPKKASMGRYWIILEETTSSSSVFKFSKVLGGRYAILLRARESFLSFGISMNHVPLKTSKLLLVRINSSRYRRPEKARGSVVQLSS